jgi:hypothetical protein
MMARKQMSGPSEFLHILFLMESIPLEVCFDIIGHSLQEIYKNIIKVNYFLPKN